ncbi:hypothetical protein AAKU58_004241 [Oxalobacteraceae bacterium GrIS 1.18]
MKDPQEALQSAYDDVLAEQGAWVHSRLPALPDGA